MAGYSMAEQKVAIVPRVVIAGALGPRDYGVLLTDRRMIFILEKSSKAIMGAVLGGVIGAVIADAATNKAEFVYADADPEVLARMDKNIVIPVSSVKRMKLKLKLGGAVSLVLEYANGEGKAKKLSGLLSPPDQQVMARRGRGEKLNSIVADYAMKTQNAFKLVLPIVAAQESEWL